MATTIVNPAPTNNTLSGNGIGFLIGIIIFILFAALFFVYALPYIRGLSMGGSGISVNVPKDINVSVQQTK